MAAGWELLGCLLTLWGLPVRQPCPKQAPRTHIYVASFNFVLFLPKTSRLLSTTIFFSLVKIHAGFGPFGKISSPRQLAALESLACSMAERGGCGAK